MYKEIRSFLLSLPATDESACITSSNYFVIAFSYKPLVELNKSMVNLVTTTEPSLSLPKLCQLIIFIGNQDM